MTRRRRARELALKALYSAALQDIPAVEILDHSTELNIWFDEDDDEEDDDVEAEPASHGEKSDQGSPIPAKQEIEAYAMRLVRMLEQRVEEFDPLISGLSKNWLPTRMPLLDRLILRMGVTELLFMPDIPRKVTINEMVDLGKLYSTEKSGQFINALLDNISPDAFNSDLMQEGYPG